MKTADYNVRFPETSSDLRSEEYFFATHNGVEQQYAIHQYREIFAAPGLYEDVTQKLKYQSPETLAMQLTTQVIKSQSEIESLVVLDIAAGTGLAGKALASLGVSAIVGVDIIPEAAHAAQRDYPGIYEKYYVEDLTNISPAAQEELVNRGLNCLVCCSSITCHFPIQGFVNSFNLIEADGWITFNVDPCIIEDIENPKDLEFKQASEFGYLYRYMIASNILDVVNKHYYLHRLMMNGKALHYVTVTARKRNNVPDNWQQLTGRC